MLGLLLIIYTLLIWALFHLLFIVYYRNIGRGILHELLYSLIGAIICTVLTVTYWKVLIVIIVIIGIIFVTSVRGIQKLLVLVVVLALSGGIYFARNEYLSYISEKDDNKELTDEEIKEAIEEFQNYFIVCNSNSSFKEFVKNGETYVSHDNGIRWINMEYYPDEWNLYRIDINAYFTTNDELDPRRLYQSFYSEDRLFPAYFLAPNDINFSEEYYLIVNGDGTITIEYREEDIDISGKYKLANQNDVDEYNSIYQKFIDDIQEEENQLLEESLGHIHNLTYKYNGDKTHTVTCSDETCDYSEVEECSYYRGTCSYCGYIWHLADRNIQEGEYISPYREGLTVYIYYNENDELILSYASPDLSEDVKLSYNYDADSFVGETDLAEYWLTGGYYGTYVNDYDISDIDLTIYRSEVERDEMVLYINNNSSDEEIEYE